MANAGFSADYQLLREHCYKGKSTLIKIKPESCTHLRNLQAIANRYIMACDEQRINHNARTHAIYRAQKNAIINLNQYRLKHWYWEPLSL